MSTGGDVSELQRIAKITLDEHTVIRRSADIEHERRVAIFDLLEENSFSPVEPLEGPYHLHMGMEEHRLVMDVRDVEDQPLTRFQLPLTPFRRLINTVPSAGQVFAGAVPRRRGVWKGACESECAVSADGPPQVASFMPRSLRARQPRRASRPSRPPARRSALRSLQPRHRS